MPYRRRTDGAGSPLLEMGVFDAGGACIEDTLLHRRYARGAARRIGVPAEPGGASAVHDHTAIYLGPILEHFGHFLLESLARLWFARRNPDLPIVWSRRVDRPGEDAPEPLTRWQTGMLDLLGVANPQVFVDAPTRFDHLLIPDVGYRIQDYFHPEHVEALAGVAHAPVPGRNVWLSRSKLNKLQNLSMPEVEARLSGLGWTILHPETLPLAELMSHLASAERIAGEQGSALHNVIFLKAPRGLRVDIFHRDPTRPSGGYNKNYDTIAEAKGFTQVVHLVQSETILRRKRIHVEKISSRVSEYIEKLTGTDVHPPRRDEPGKPGAHRPVPPGRPNVSATRINRLAAIRGAKSYLEIGVANGRTFLNVAVGTKHGVDPKFRFDTRPHASASVRFFEMTSDRFFAGVAPGDARYDVIFLDGLHTFEQTFRDFCATMPHAHADTIWIIDDVFPSDVFSAIPSQKAAVNYRKLHGGTARLWHGDVFKCVFAIHDFFPNFSFRTIKMEGENPQTVVVNRPRADFEPISNDLEKISRMDYFAFLENSHVLNLSSCEDVIEWATASLGSDR